MVVNFGPTPEGTFRKEELTIADYLGKWMKRNGEAIYGCDYAKLKKQDWGYFTRNSQYTYMVVFNMPFSGHLTVKVPKGKKILEAETLNGKKVSFAESTTCEYQISTPHPVSNDPFVIRLKIDQGANKVYQAPLT